jgi:hypothetical protein
LFAAIFAGEPDPLRRNCSKRAEGRHQRTQFFYWMLRVPVLFAEHELKAMNVQARTTVRGPIDRDPDSAERAVREHVEATMVIAEPALQF